ncbi:ribbon-helix-helix domain-containing protein [Rhodocista pekingensis]|uniref:Ribbon-helix-helix domain-containing protein n=1 Tax=Rhodocista pekingensis TaxID=201185 RepID=A0ABW2KR85_9PROT
MRSICKNVTVAGRRTSVRMEPIMWQCLDEICRREGRTVHEIVTLIDRLRGDGGLTAALRIFLVGYLQQAASRSPGLLSTAAAGTTAAGATAAGPRPAPHPILGMSDEAAGYNPGARRYSPAFEDAIRIFDTLDD